MPPPQGQAEQALHLSRGQLGGDGARREHPHPLRHRGQPDPVIESPERGAQGGHVRGVLARWQHGVATRDQIPADGAHHDGQRGVVAHAARSMANTV